MNESGWGGESGVVGVPVSPRLRRNSYEEAQNVNAPGIWSLLKIRNLPVLIIDGHKGFIKINKNINNLNSLLNRAYTIPCACYRKVFSPLSPLKM